MSESEVDKVVLKVISYQYCGKASLIVEGAGCTFVISKKIKVYETKLQNNFLTKLNATQDGFIK